MFYDLCPMNRRNNLNLKSAYQSGLVGFNTEKNVQCTLECRRMKQLCLSVQSWDSY